MDEITESDFKKRKAAIGRVMQASALKTLKKAEDAPKMDDSAALHYLKEGVRLEEEYAVEDIKKKSLARPRTQPIQRKRGAPIGNQNAKTHGLYSKSLPAYTCDVCQNADKCHKYVAGHVCAYREELVEGCDFKTVDEVVEYMQSQLKTRSERMKMGLLQERLSGAKDIVVSDEAATIFENSYALARFLKEKDGGTKPPASNIFASIFMNPGGVKSVASKIIDDPLPEEKPLIGLPRN